MTDEDLLRSLADLVDRLDPPPADLAARARAALAERSGAELSRLLTDSAHTAEPGLRGAGHVRVLRFADLDLRLELTATGLRVTGLARTGTHAVTRWPGGARTTGIDPAGWFHVDGVPPGPVRFVLRRPGRPDLATRWFVA
ncbi:hypothetical protein [Saccharothrix algeriensis]|uniref:Uncharacterized protein n=1 Tax=Saccharothrix algeriensis TaxID=173560 RepID=A0A8T8HRP7_9PSEU|nr:hypothetical protein [Saccharothrix algeriensis]MBM7812511.1 hypothetical protein [Saccharothrix algeriensis]QTR01243.1 hypothetical protein J7S33_17365 [Saccharothrix algeriensis]